MASEEEVLQSLGLTGNEAKAYLALTYLGPSIASDVAQKAGVHRALAYNTLARLVQKGFASEIVQDKVRRFTAVPPHELRLKLEEKESELRKSVDSLVEALKKTYRRAPLPSVNVFTGQDGIKSILADELDDTREGGTIYAYRALPETSSPATVFMSWWHKKRVQKKVQMNFLMDSSPQSVEAAEGLRKLGLAEVRFLNERQHAPVTYHLYSEKVTIISVSPEETLGIIIESPAINALFKQDFLWHWQRLAPKEERK